MLSGKSEPFLEEKVNFSSKFKIENFNPKNDDNAFESVVTEIIFTSQTLFPLTGHIGVLPMSSSNQTIFSYRNGSIPRSFGESRHEKPFVKACSEQEDCHVRQQVYTKIRPLFIVSFYHFFYYYNRSDTDSGHSSAQGDRDIYAIYNNECDRKVIDKRTLKVSRTATEDHRPCDAPFNKFNPIGYSIPSEMEDKPLEPLKRLQVTRRRDEILKRRNRSRRNTIAVNLLDVKNGNLCHSNVSWDGSCSKSTNCIDKIGTVDENSLSNKIDAMQLGRCSMPGIFKRKK